VDAARFTRAVVCRPSSTFAAGITKAQLGPPDLTVAETQHERYCAALQHAGLRLTRIPAAEEFPDGCFVEDVAVVTRAGAIYTHPGAPVRRGEVGYVRGWLETLVPMLATIEPPGTLDGGDVCDAEDRTFIGLTARTNEAGAAQLARILEPLGQHMTIVDLRPVPGLLHLKSGFAFLGDGRFACAPAIATLPEIAGLPLVTVEPDEAYAANAVRVNDVLLIASGHPLLEARLRGLGYDVVALAMSEFRKLDGGLSCLSLRF